MSRKKILITGGSGFIGGHLANYLEASGYEVSILDIITPEPRIKFSHFIHADVNDTDNLGPVLEDHWFAIFHFAAIVSVPLCEMSPLESFQTNLVSTQNLLEIIRKNRSEIPPRIFFSSSAAVYGNLGKVCAREALALQEPISFYGLQKYASEQLLRLYAERHQIRGLSFRFFNVYGPHQSNKSPYSGVITKFKHALCEGSEVKLFNYGNNFRDFIHVADIVSACAKALKLPEHFLNGNTVNLCTEESISIADLCEKMKKFFHSASLITTQPSLNGDIQYSFGSSQAAAALLDWTPRKFACELIDEL